MQIELNQATFRRLIQFYLGSLMLVFTVASLEYSDALWPNFTGRSEDLIAELFGTSGPSEAMLIPSIIGLVGIVIWNVSSSIGLLWYRRWARFGIWASVLATYGSILILDGYRPTYSSPVSDLVLTLNAMLLGAIVILAYARNCGAAWFEPAPIDRQE